MTTKNTITKEHIDSLLAQSKWEDSRHGVKTTVVCLTMPNGFEIIESSGCVDPANYRHDLGVEICKKRIVDQVWKLEGYALASELALVVLKGVHIARVCHEVNRAYCEALGDHSQPQWETAPQWQRDSALLGVKLHMENPDAGPQASHESWMAQKVANGWQYGFVKDPVAKTHPCLVPFDQLPPAQQAKDFIFRAVVHALA